ncbi:MAG TPA: polysaccharide biosynthesis tyrosine autokinase [Chthoniobacteraceae bacterium]|jgi:capsular exopolysaccharide synthesis family protein|nr:polysaccharide biosynthesis tyrosine autokinase [Chthoniobacteraceae bacterium]
MSDSTEVKLHFLDYWRVIKARAGIIILTFLLTMITAAVTVYFLPREYFSKATMEVKPDGSAFDVFGSQSGAGAYTNVNVNDPRLSPTQMKILTEKGILYPVIDQLNLTARWGNGGAPISKEQAYGKLSHMLDLNPIRQTDLIEIGVWSTDPKESAEIANSIAVVYQDRRIKDQMSLIDTSLTRLKDEVNQHEKEVADLGAAAAKMRAELDIVDPDTENMSTSAAEMDTQSVRAVEQQVEDAEYKTEELQTRLAEVDSLKPDQLMVALHLFNIDDPTVLKILPLYQDAVSEEARLLSSGLGPNHPRIKELRAQKDVYTQQLDQQIQSIKASMSAQLQLAKATQAALEHRLSISKTESIEKRNQDGEYTDAKYRYVEAKRLLEAARQRYETQSMQENMSMQVAKIWESAEPALAPGRPKVLFYLVLAAIIGGGLGIGLAFFLEYLDTSVKSLEDVERFLGVPVLAVIPKNVGILMHQQGDTPDAETYRILRTNIEFNRKNPDANTLTLISGGPGEGKSTTLFNLAYTCAKGGYSVLVVDADLRRPSQHRLFGVENNVGLSNYLTSNMPFEEVVRTTGVENLSFIPSGQLPRDAVGILNSQRMTDLIRNTKLRYDLVMFDSPPILGVSDGAVLASEVDLSVMVIEHRRFPRSMLQRVKQAVLNVGGNLLGVVLNKVDSKHDSGYGYYSSYYDYYSSNNTEESAVSAGAKANGRRQAGKEQEVHGGEQY